MLNSLDTFLLGIFGGALSSGVIFNVMYIHFHNKFKHYFYNKEHFKTRMRVSELEDKVKSLSIQVASLNAEIYHRVTEDQYK